MPSVDAFERFLGELADHEGAGAKPHIVSATPPEQPAGPVDRVLNQLQNAILQEAVFVAASAGVANALEQQTPGVSRHAIAIVLPEESLYRKWLPDIEDGSDEGYQLSARVHDLVARIGLARRMSLAFVEAGAGETPVDPDMLGDAWRRAAASAKAAITLIDAAIGNVDGGGPLVASGPILALLTSAVAGETACVDPDGKVSVPGWVERRRAPRRVHNLEITVESAGHEYPSTLKDVSSTGAGLDGDVPAAPADPVVLWLADGRQLRGRVAWNSGKRYGVHFDRPLPANDPLLPQPD